MAGPLADLLLRVALASLEHLQGPYPNQRDRRNERTQPSWQAPSLRHHNYQKRPCHPRRGALRRVNVTGLVWTLVLQPLLPDWVCKGDANPLGLHDCTHGPLVIVSFTVNWDEPQDDVFVKMTTRRAVEQIEVVAAANKTGHPWRYLNYCAEWQRPFKSYGEENWRFLQGVSKKYDPESLFQKGCIGGFKLDVCSRAKA